MKITKEALKRLIKEELSEITDEHGDPTEPTAYAADREMRTQLAVKHIREAVRELRNLMNEHITKVDKPKPDAERDAEALDALIRQVSSVGEKVGNFPSRSLDRELPI